MRRILKMATKYQLDAIRARIVSAIEADWPLSLDEWNKVDLLMDLKSKGDGLRFKCLPSDAFLPEPAAAIALARQFDIPKILPAAYYELSRRIIIYDRSSTDSSIKSQARGYLLSLEDLQIFCRIRDYLHSYAVESGEGGLGCLTGSYNKCEARGHSDMDCRSAGDKLINDILTKTQCVEVKDIFRQYRMHIADENWDYPAFCWPCSEAVRKEIRSDAQILWDEITYDILSSSELFET